MLYECCPLYNMEIHKHTNYEAVIYPLHHPFSEEVGWKLQCQNQSHVQEEVEETVHESARHVEGLNKVAELQGRASQEVRL